MSRNELPHAVCFRDSPMPDRDARSSLLVAALGLARRGWFVFPLRPGTKIPALRHWQHHATTDPARIRAWWTAYPTCNIGIACGPSRLLVLDLDAAHGPIPARWAIHGVTHGRDVLALRATRVGQPDPRDTFTVATPSGGEHRYFQHPPGARLRSTVGERGHGLGWHVDTRGPGSLITAPGSHTTRDGHLATWRIIRDQPPTLLPNWLVTALTPPNPPPAAPHPTPHLQPDSPRVAAYVRAALEQECHNVATAEPGHRHITLFAAAAALGELAAHHWIHPATITRHLTHAAHHHLGVQGFTPTELHRTIHDGIRTGLRNPRILTDTWAARES